MKKIPNVIMSVIKYKILRRNSREFIYLLFIIFKNCHYIRCFFNYFTVRVNMANEKKEDITQSWRKRTKLIKNDKTRERAPVYGRTRFSYENSDI